MGEFTDFGAAGFVMAVDAGCENTAIKWSWGAHDFAVGRRIRFRVSVKAWAGAVSLRALPFDVADD